MLRSCGFTPAFRALAPQFAQMSGDTTRLVLGASMGATPTAIPNRLSRGEPADVLLMVGAALDTLSTAVRLVVVPAELVTATVKPVPLSELTVAGVV